MDKPNPRPITPLGIPREVEKADDRFAANNRISSAYEYRNRRAMKAVWIVGSAVIAIAAVRVWLDDTPPPASQKSYIEKLEEYNECEINITRDYNSGATDPSAHPGQLAEVIAKLCPPHPNTPPTTR